MQPYFWKDLVGVRQTHTFIHPTKCGGTALEQFFDRVCPGRIGGSGHANISSAQNNPIIVLREPFDRFSSIFRYWKSGAETGPYQRAPELLTKYAGTTPKQFIRMIAEGRGEDLYADVRWSKEHFIPQSHWLPPEAMPHAIVLAYAPDLAPAVSDLFKYLRIEASTDLPKVNVSRRDATVELDDEDRRWIRQAFATDFDLMAGLPMRNNVARVVCPRLSGFGFTKHLERECLSSSSGIGSADSWESGDIYSWLSLVRRSILTVFSGHR
jgi:hypothetical protein